MRFFAPRAGLVVFALAVGALAAGTDPVGEVLDKAKVAYHADVEKATQDLTAAMDARIKSAADEGSLDVVLALRADKAAFEEAEVSPKSRLLKTSSAAYSSAVKTARKKMSDAYEQAVKDYTKKLDTDRAEVVRQEHLAFKAGPNRRPWDAPAGAAPVVEVPLGGGVKMIFCRVPPGKAILGSPPTEAGRTDLEAQHEFSTDGFWLGKFEVTQAEWVSAMKTNPSVFNGRDDNPAKGLNTGRFPVENVAWDDCQKFLNALNARRAKPFPVAGAFDLPTEDEWEYACRGGTGGRPFYFGEQLDGRQANSNGKKPYGTTAAGPALGRTAVAGTYAAEAPHPWGLCDMHGNVFEFCHPSVGAPKNQRALRGGCYDGPGTQVRAASRNFNTLDIKYFNLGFRVCFRPN